METIGIRELQQRASVAVRRVQAGETLGITQRGRLVAILSPTSGATGLGALIASGRARLPRSGPRTLPDAVAASESTSEALAELRGS